MRGLRRAFWAAVSAIAYWRGLMIAATQDDRGMTHTDPPCARCDERRNAERARIDALRRMG